MANSSLLITREPQSPVSRAVIKLCLNKATLCKALRAPGTNVSLLLWLVFPRCLTSSSALAAQALWLRFKPQARAAPVFILVIYTLWWLMDSYVLGFTATTSNQAGSGGCFPVPPLAGGPASSNRLSRQTSQHKRIICFRNNNFKNA